MADQVFDLINSITYDKIDLISGNDQMIDQYNPYIVNKALSQFVDTVLWANEVNRRPTMFVDAQYHLLFHSIRKRKRYTKWAKRSDDKLVAAIQQIASCNAAVAKQMIPLLDQQQRQQLIDLVASVK